jgi:hypothetical protein
LSEEFDGKTAGNKSAVFYACRRMSVLGGKAVMQRTSPQGPVLTRPDVGRLGKLMTDLIPCNPVATRLFRANSGTRAALLRTALFDHLVGARGALVVNG